MVIKGAIRGNGRQLAAYLTSQKQNDAVRILDVDRMQQFTEADFKNLLRDMSLNEQLTRSRQGLYHAVINPSPEESLRMDDASWEAATEILAEELGFAEQRRAVVLHQTQYRRHAHVVFERYNHQTGRMLGIAHNYRKQDKARARMEQAFQHQPTPKRNVHRADMKAALTALWKDTDNAASFIRKARTEGYAVSTGFGRTPFMVVDGTGRSFNLIRHLDGVKTKEVRDRFKGTVLMGEKEAIAFARSRQGITMPEGEKQAAPTRETNPADQRPAKEKSSRDLFLENLSKQREQQQQQQRPRGPRLH